MNWGGQPQCGRQPALPPPAPSHRGVVFELNSEACVWGGNMAGGQKADEWESARRVPGRAGSQVGVRSGSDLCKEFGFCFSLLAEGRAKASEE